MDLIDRLRELAARAPKVLDQFQTEEARKRPALTGVISTATVVRPDSLHRVARSILGRRGINSMRVAKIRAATIPRSIRRVGLSRQFLRGVDNGHIRPVSTFQKGKHWASNQRWEMAKLNRAAGAARKPAGFVKANANALRMHGAKALVAGGCRVAVTGAVFAVAIETPLAVWRQRRQITRDGKPVREAVSDGAKEVGVAATAGGIASTAVYGLTAAGLQVVLLPVGAIMIGSGIWSARRKLKSRRIEPKSTLGGA